MKIDENLFTFKLQQVHTKIAYERFYVKRKSDDDLFYFSSVFTRRARPVECRFAAPVGDSISLVQNSGKNI